jgi:Domain of unknown function (DUF802)
MTKFRFDWVVFFVGLAVVCWIGVGYVGANALALAVTLSIGACYLSGALELWRYQQATATLARAVAGLSEPPVKLDDWLQPLHHSLRSAVRMRIEGERVALPGPALTPYLVGLLVLLGMLGTFTGMVVTLRGTGAALGSATDLEAIRASLAAPLKGLGFAFGTSIAGVATSAMLGLLSALYRRDRTLAAQRLDEKIATTLRPYSHAHQRQAMFELLQRQAEVMPVLVDRLQTMMTSIEQGSQAANERQIVNQQAFLLKAEAAYANLASSLGESLKQSAAESARAAGAALQPVVEATMAGLARESASLHDTITHAVQRQLDGLSAGFAATSTAVSDICNQALMAHQRQGEALAQRLHHSLERVAESFELRSAGMTEGVLARLDATARGLSEGWSGALARQEEVSEKLAARNEQALAAASATFEQHAAALSRTMGQSHAQLQADLASRDQQRIEGWTNTLASMAATLRKEWEAASAHTTSRQQEICETLARTAREMLAQTQAHASDTIAAISTLVQTASEGPRAAAELVAELRQNLSNSVARDTAMLEEHNRLLQALSTVLDAVNRASADQRSAVDQLIASSSDLLDRVGTQFADKVEADTGKLGTVAAQVSASAVEVASLAEAFELAVHTFGQSNDKLMTHLERIEGALEKSLVRSDEQLAYYVAQAREVIDLSMTSQKQIVEDLQQLAAQRASAGVAAT